MLEIAEPPIDAVVVNSFDKMRSYYEDDKTIKYIGGFNTKNLFHGFGIFFLENGKKIYEGYWKKWTNGQ